MKKTKLYSIHQQLQGKMIDFFGWELPVEYKGIVDEHLAVRNKAGLFDVSHMGEIEIAGKGALDFLQYLTPNNVARLEPGKAQYSALTTPQGTFVDDLLIYMLEDEKYLLVVNAANTEKDFNWITDHQKNFDVSVNNLSQEFTQLALQGPLAENILNSIIDIDLSKIKSFHFDWGKIAGEEVIVSRTGYTGEDGFEIYSFSNNPGKIWKAIMKEGTLQGMLPVGLGARDTLRLEACLMLYGNDIDESTTVLEAGLGWLVKFKKGDFLGKDVLLAQKEKGIKRRLVGFELVDRGVPRPHYSVFLEGKKVSEVTSGTFAPYLKKSIGLTYLPVEYTEEGTEIQVEIRGRKVKAKIVQIPFYKRKI